MKLPFAFNLASFMRLFMPGLALAVSVYPVADLTFRAIGIEDPGDVYFVFASVFLGWLVVLLDMPIYMLYEGRRFWPSFFAQLGRSRQQRRLQTLNRYLEKSKEARNPPVLSVEYEIRRDEFPLDKEGKHHIIYPTRIGNLITEYEQYPDKKYGMDGVFYWYRVWLASPKDVREEIMQHQAVADSAVYMSVIFYVSALLFALYGVVNMLGSVAITPSIGSYWLIGAVLALGCGYVFYHIALQAHSIYGSYFKAMFDNFHGKVNVKLVLSSLTKRTGIYEYENLDGPEAYQMAWRFLRWHRLRRPGENKNVNAEELFETSQDH